MPKSVKCSVEFFIEGNILPFLDLGSTFVPIQSRPQSSLSEKAWTSSIFFPAKKIDNELNKSG